MNRWDPDARPNKDAEAAVNEHGENIVPIEAVISDKNSKSLHKQAELTEQILAERRSRAKEPVHMEGLKPIPDALRSTLPGAGVIPGGPEAMGLAPSMRRAIPAPYQRDRISIDHHGKTWGYMKASDVQPGDIVVDFGKIHMATGFVEHDTDFSSRGRPIVATREGIKLTNIAGDFRDFDSQEQLRVFRVHDAAEDT